LKRGGGDLKVKTFATDFTDLHRLPDIVTLAKASIRFVQSCATCKLESAARSTRKIQGQGWDCGCGVNLRKSVKSVAKILSVCF
jgi:hypothetical protein